LEAEVPAAKVEQKKQKRSKKRYPNYAFENERKQY